MRSYIIVFMLEIYANGVGRDSAHVIPLLKQLVAFLLRLKQGLLRHFRAYTVRVQHSPVQDTSIFYKGYVNGAHTRKIHVDTHKIHVDTRKIHVETA